MKEIERDNTSLFEEKYIHRNQQCSDAFDFDMFVGFAFMKGKLMNEMLIYAYISKYIMLNVFVFCICEQKYVTS